VAASGTSSKTLQLLRTRLRQLVRVTVVSAIGLALAATIFAIWWLSSLNALRDIGEPFDVEAFRAFRIPDDQNAFALLRRANEKYVPIRELTRGARASNPTVPWSLADPKLREWAEANRKALELFQKAAAKPDAANSAGEPATLLDNPDRLIWVALLEGSRQQENGNSAGAWDCYRAVLRMLKHVRKRGNLNQRYDAHQENSWLQQRLASWAADPKTTISQLQFALEEVLKSEPQSDWDSFALRSGYLEIMRALDRPMPPYSQEELDGDTSRRLGDMALSPEMIRYLETARRFVLREPERSRRVLKLLCANYLAHVESRARPPRPPAVWTTFTHLTSTNPIRTGTTKLPLYPVSPDAPAGARALSPPQIANWLVTTHDARLRLLLANNSGWSWPPDRLADRRAHAHLVITLASELYRRERGSPPPSEAALVGTYLECLPDDGSAELGEATTVE
jgi:hypothetical protein